MPDSGVIKPAQLIKELKDGRQYTPGTALNFRGKSLQGEDLQGLDLSGADLSDAKLFKAKLTSARLKNASLDRAELSGADLRDADMENVSATDTGFGMANLENANLFNAKLDNATLTMSNLRKADLKAASLQGARLREATLCGTDFTSANLRNTDMSLCDVKGACFNNADMRGARLRLMVGFDTASWIGVDIRDIDFSGAYQMRRFIRDQNFLEEFRRRSRLSNIVYHVWWVTSDCGRSLARWFFWTVCLVLLFGWLYTLVGIDYGPYQTWLSPIYYSVVTMTTLGYGDVVPASTAAQIVAMLEALIGYLMLGGLLSILTNKMARRAD